MNPLQKLEQQSQDLVRQQEKLNEEIRKPKKHRPMSRDGWKIPCNV